MPVVAGHEGAGIVESLGDGVTDLRVGDHVVLSWAPNCGHCFYCNLGKPNLCDTYTGPIWSGTMLDGTTRLRHRGREIYSYCGTAAFATHTVVPRVSCIAIRKDVPLDRACLVGCAVATGVGAVMFTARVKPGESVAVVGCGGVGLNIIQGARLCGARTIVAIDANESKRPIAMRFGATDFTGAVGATFDHVFEAVGIPALQERAMELVRPGGTLTLSGLSPMGSITNFPAAVIARKELTIRGSYYGSVNPQRDFPMLIDLYAQKKLLLDELITRRYPLEGINDAFAAMIAGQVARGVILL
jgi:Zn-dependent alcohol dehydrogenase